MLACVVTLGGSLPAHAETAKVDWATGYIVARGIGIANRAAPTPAAARGPARRAAEDAARRELRAALPTLPLASGGTFAARSKDARTAAAIDAALATATVLAAEPETDGSWKVTLGLPIEAVRQALAGARVVTESDDALPVVVVEGVTAKPAVGYQIGALAAATVWPKAIPAWAKQAPRVKARSTARGSITVQLPAKATEATLFVLVQ